jgi:hypothetical protein
MTYRTTGITLILIGVILLLVSLTADRLGGHAGFGRYQTMGIVVGVVVAGLGFNVYSRK